MSKIIQRKQRLFREANGGLSTLYADQAGGMRKMKCPTGCGGMAVPSGQADQKNRFICQACGTAFTSTPM